MLENTVLARGNITVLTTTRRRYYKDCQAKVSGYRFIGRHAQAGGRPPLHILRPNKEATRKIYISRDAVKVIRTKGLVFEVCYRLFGDLKERKCSKSNPIIYKKELKTCY